MEVRNQRGIPQEKKKIARPSDAECCSLWLHGRVELHVCGPPEADESHGFGSRQLTLLDLERWCSSFTIFFARSSRQLGRVFSVVSENFT